MSLPDAIAGGRRPSLLVTWYQEGTTTPENLTGATLTGKIRRGVGSGTTESITGTLTVTDAEAGVFRWDFSAADVATVGNFEVQFTATFGVGQSPAKTFVTRWDVVEALT